MKSPAFKALALTLSMFAGSHYASASEYTCKAPNLSAWLVFDDGPGGLDAFKLTYGQTHYVEVLWDKTTPNTVEGAGDNAPGDRYEYGGDELAMSILGQDKFQFFFEAKREDPKSQVFKGTMTVADPQGNYTQLPLTCKHL